MNTICIACPNGCELTVEPSPKGFIVKGNKCAKGKNYGVQEATDPRRIVTAVAVTASPEWPCIPVKTDKAVPRAVIPELLESIYAKHVELPAKEGRALIENFQGTGISVVFTRTIPPRQAKRPV